MLCLIGIPRGVLSFVLQPISMSRIVDDGDSQQEEWVEEPDSVDARFAGEYSEDTREMMKQFDKPKWMEEESSLDPIEDMEDYINHDLRLPPTTYDAAQQAAADEIAELQAAKEDVLDPESQSIVRYRKQLVEGTSLNDVKLLKLRAYHRAMDQQRARQNEFQSPEGRKQLMEYYGVPLDRVPQELIDMTPEQLADRWQQAQHGAAASARDHAWASYSEDSEWAPDWGSSSYLHNESTRDLLQQGFLPAGSHESEVDAPQQNPLDEFGELLFDGDPKNYKVWQPVHGYTPEYLEQQSLEKRLRMQQRQRALAFWVPLTTVTGVYIMRTIKRLLTRRGGPTGKKKSPSQQRLVA